MTRASRAWAVSLGATALALAGCREATTAPGACPDFCPPASVQLVDTVLGQGIVGDSTFIGFVNGSEAAGMQLVNDTGATSGVTQSRSVIRFIAFPDRLPVAATDTVTGAVVGIDSFAVTLPVVLRSQGVAGLELALHRLPADIDTTASFASLEPFFADSTLLMVLPIPDSLTADTISTVLPDSAFPTFDSDGRRASIGVVLRSPEPAFLTLGAIEVGNAAILTRFARVDSGAGEVEVSDARQPDFDTFVAAPLPLPAADVLRVGGVPAARAVLRLDIPSSILDSAKIVRATLVLVLTEAVLGAPTDSARILVQRVSADVGAKSPLVTVRADSIPFRSTLVTAGATDTVRIDITDLLTDFQLDPERPRVVVLRAVPEGASFVEARFGSTANAATRPVLHITFVPPVDFFR